MEIKHSDGQIQLLERKINQCWNYTEFSIAMIRGYQRLPEATRGYQRLPEAFPGSLERLFWQKILQFIDVDPWDDR